MTKNESFLQNLAKRKANISQLAEEVTMVSIPKMIGVVMCSAVLFLSLSNVVQARMSPSSCADRKGGQPNLLKCDEDTLRGIETIKGEVLRVDGDTLLLERFNGQQMRLHIETTTKTSHLISRGDRIEAKVNEVDHQKHVLSLRQLE
jgi:hypothetical protein